MGRPVHISKERILAAARSVFLEHGFSASTAKVAQAAGVSEGSIFKRFATKEALFVAALAEPLMQMEIEPRPKHGDLQADLQALMVTMTERFRETLPNMMMLWAHTNPVEVFKSMDEPPPVVVRKKMTAYLQAEREAGRLNASDPETIARVMVASSHAYVFQECMLAGQPSLTTEEHAERVVRLILEGAR